MLIQNIIFSDGSSKAIILTLELQTGFTRVVTLTGGTLIFQTSTDLVGRTERGPEIHPLLSFSQSISFPLFQAPFTFHFERNERFK